MQVKIIMQVNIINASKACNKESMQGMLVRHATNVSIDSIKGSPSANGMQVRNASKECQECK